MPVIRYTAATALRNLWESKVTSLFTLVTLSVALGFMGAYLAVYMNVSSALDALGEKFPLTVYLEDSVSAGQTSDIRTKLKSSASVSGYEYTSKEKALAQFRSGAGAEGSLIESLGSNPLPASLDVRLKAGSDPDAVSALARELRRMPGVEDVQFLAGEAGRLRSMLAAFRLAGLILGLGVLLGVVFISYSTLRLAVLSHADEIEAEKLLGATRLFIMGPFLVEGALQGLVAAGLSLGLLFGLLRLVSGASAAALLRPAGLEFLPAWAVAGLLAAGGLLGFTGSLFAFARRLRM